MAKAVPLSIHPTPGCTRGPGDPVCGVPDKYGWSCCGRKGYTEAPSPFFPDTLQQYAWDSTSLEALKRCPRLYYYTMIRRLRGKEESIHLRFGREVHQALHDYEIAKAEGKNHVEALDTTISSLANRICDWNPNEEQNGKAGKVKNRETLFRTVIWYLDDHEHDPAETVILENGMPALEVSFQFDLAADYILCGHLDRIVKWDDSLFVMDRKTTTYGLGSYYFQQFEVHNQMSLYSLAGQVVLSSPVKGVIIDAMQIQITDTKFGRSVTYRNEGRLEEWLNDLDYHINSSKIYAEGNYWPQNDTACDKYGGCAFREVCSKSPNVREKFIQASFVEGEQWNPLKAR
jgi:PD-(D/E)XK nuclease superfamily